jgi:L-lysine exporter family protein LysE/ArgO
LVSAAVVGFFTGLTLIIAIGAQNAFVLRLGLARNHVGIAVVVCAVSDALLIVLGISGLGALFRSIPTALVVMKWVGVAYLLWYAFRSFRSAMRPAVLVVGEQSLLSRRSVLLMVLGFTFLNPHVYLDTVLLLGSIGNQYQPNQWWFALGAALASITWFTALGFGARTAAPLMSRPITWRILDIGIGVIMLAIALRLATMDLG